MSKEQILTSFIGNIPTYLGRSLIKLTEKNLKNLKNLGRLEHEKTIEFSSNSSLNSSSNISALTYVPDNNEYEVIYHNLIEYINKDSPPLRINGGERIINIDEQKQISNFLTEISKIKHKIKSKDFIKEYIQNRYGDEYTFNCDRINDICDRLHDKDAIIQYIIFLLIINSYPKISITKDSDNVYEIKSESGNDDDTKNKNIEINRKCLIYLLLNDIPFPFPFINQEDEEYNDKNNTFE